MLCNYGIRICKQTLKKLRESKEGLQESNWDLLNFNTRKDKIMQPDDGDLIEMYKLTS